MNMKRMFCILMLAVMCILPAVQASENVEKIQAQVNKDLKILFNGQPLTFVEDEKVLSPIVYGGVTYVPLLSISKLTNLEVRLDQASSTISLGPTEDGTSLLDTFEPYAINGTVEVVHSSMGQNQKIASKTHTRWLKYDLTKDDDKWDNPDYLRPASASAFFDLEGKFSTLTFKAYSGDGDKNLTVLGDNKAVLGEFLIVDKNLPQTIKIDVTNVSQIEIYCDETYEYNKHLMYPAKNFVNRYLYILDAYVKLNSEPSVEPTEASTSMVLTDETKASAAVVLTGEAEGFGGSVKVTVTLDGDKIVKVKAVGESETEGIGTPALDILPRKMIEKNSADVDVLAGATYTSEAIINAMKTALEGFSPGK